MSLKGRNLHRDEFRRDQKDTITCNTTKHTAQHEEEW